MVDSGRWMVDGGWWTVDVKAEMLMRLWQAVC